jgi:hypothetical protein
VRLEQHELSKIFPALSELEFDQLVSDIQQNGLIQPVVIFEDKVLDGWHRYRACHKANGKMKVVEYEGDNPAAFVKSQNWVRRHLTSSQRAAAIAALSEWAKDGRPKTGPFGPGIPKSTNKSMAKEAKVSEAQIKRAKHVLKNGSAQLKESVANGEITLSAAERKISKKKKKGPIGAAPKPPKEPKPTKSEVKALAKLQGEFASLKEVHAKLIEEYNELMENRDTLADEVQTYDDVRDNETAKVLLSLRGDNRLLTRRDKELTFECSELKKHLAFWRKRAEKCEAARSKK